MSIEKYFGGKAVWIGENPVHIAESINLTAGTNWRAPRAMHGRFDRVWLYEEELFSNGPSWPLLVDECLRFLGHRGYLILRTCDCGHGTLFELKSMIARRPGLTVELVFQTKLPGGDTVIVVDVQRENLADYIDDGWSIGILSNGTKSSNVHSLVEKLMRLAGERPLQIVIAGPEKPALDQHVTGSEEEWSDRPGDKLPRIGEKKNWIVRQARNSNIAIFHDRYQVDDNFFTGFGKFGLDFDYVTIRQRYESGAYYPSYIGFPLRKMRWQRPEFDATYRTLHDGHFINGGLIILKRHIASVVNFNPLLLHNEAEDVELSFILRTNGIVPRMNPHSSALALGVTENYTSTFYEILSSSPSTPRRLRVVFKQVVVVAKRLLPFTAKQFIRKTSLYAKLQRYLRLN
jgi:hypothetical protein